MVVVLVLCVTKGRMSIQGTNDGFLMVQWRNGEKSVCVTGLELVPQPWPNGSNAVTGIQHLLYHIYYLI